MHDHLETLRAAVVATAVAVAAAVVGVIESVDPMAIAGGLGAGGGVSYVVWRVWSDDRARLAVQETLEEQIAALTVDRDKWLQRAADLQAEVLRLSVELAKRPPP